MLVLSGMAMIVGTGAAMAAWLLLKLIALVTNLAWFGTISTGPSEIADVSLGAMTLAIPILGSLVIGLMARFGSDKIRGHGIPEAIEAILFGESRLSLKVAILKPLSSAISIGSGGPFGAEGPIIMTGGAIGSLFAQCFHLSGAERKTLLVAGAAAGMTTIFGTPIAAILLALEVLLFEWKPRSFVPVVVGTLMALALRPSLVGSSALFPLVGSLPGTPWLLPVGALLGLATGLAATLFSTALYRIEDGFHRLPIHWMWWPALGAVVVGVGGLIDPRVLGAGYANIDALIEGTMMLRAALMLLTIKAIVWLVALGSGTSGGVLAPLLILGGSIGAIAGHWLGHPGFWALAGMAGMMSAAMRAPLTGAIFAAELSGRLDVLPGVAAASVAGYALAVLMLRRSILTEKIARRGRHLSQEYSVDPLETARIGDLMTSDPETLDAAMPAVEMLAFFEQGAHHRSYPVINSAGCPVGLVSRADALRWGSSGGEQGLTLDELASDRSMSIVTPEMPASIAADLMIAEDIGRLPVVDASDGRLVGIVARRDLLQARTGLHRAESERKRFVGYGRGRETVALRS